MVYVQGFDFRPEFKLLIFFIYYGIAVALGFIFVTIGSRNANDNGQKLVEYFICESFGVDITDPCILDVNHQETQALISGAYFAYTLGPYATLVFIFPIDKVKRKWKSWRESKTGNS